MTSPNPYDNLLSKRTPRITIYLGSFNRQSRLNESLKSISEQSFSDFDILITDNGSNPPLQLPAFALIDPRYQLVRLSQNQDRFITPYELIKSFKSEYIAFACDDDIWHPQKLEKQIAFLDGSPEIGACFTRIVPVDDNGAELKFPPKPFNGIFDAANRSRAGWVRQFFHNGNCVCFPSALIRREVLESIMVRVPYIQLGDLFLWIGVLRHGSIHIMEEKLIRYRISLKGEQESAKSKRNISRLVYELSRLLHDFRKLPTSVIFEAFNPVFPDDCRDERDRADFALFVEAMNNGSQSHLRFASELAEANFIARALDPNSNSAIFWHKRYELATARVALKLSRRERITRSLKKLFHF